MKKSKKAGFSITEVMVATVILGLAITALADIYGYAVKKGFFGNTRISAISFLRDAKNDFLAVDMDTIAASTTTTSHVSEVMGALSRTVTIARSNQVDTDQDGSNNGLLWMADTSILIDDQEGSAIDSISVRFGRAANYALNTTNTYNEETFSTEGSQVFVTLSNVQKIGNSYTSGSNWGASEILGYSDGKIPFGAKITLKADAALGRQFLGWRRNNSIESSDTVYTIPRGLVADETYEAVFIDD